MATIETTSKKIEQLILSVREATNRTRTVFLFVNLSALVILIALFNTTWSWQRHINFKERPYTSYVKQVGLDSGKNESDNELRKHYADIYFERQYFTIPLLGIRISESDLTIFSPTAFLIFTTWFFFALRRENHLVSNVKTDFDKLTKKIKGDMDGTTENKDDWKILIHNLYAGCVQNFVLTTPTNNDYKKAGDRFGKNMIARPILSFLNWLPVLILLLLLYDDISEYCNKNYMKIHGSELIILDSILFLMTLLIIYQISLITILNRNTRNILKQMADEMKTGEYNYEL